MSTRSRRVLLGVSVVAVGFLPTVAAGGIDAASHGALTLASSVMVGASAIAYPIVARRLGALGTPELRALLLASLGLGIFVFATGIFYGLTDEPFTTPRYAALFLSGVNPYTTTLTIHYTQCASVLSPSLVACAQFTDSSVFTYLPLLPFLALPDLAYPVTTLLAWAATLYLLRDRRWALLALGSPYVALLAANGYNDLPPMFLLTFAFGAGLSARRSAVVEIAALGAKQFANVVAVLIHAWRRQWGPFLAAIAVSVAWVLPWLLVNPRAVVCTVALHLSSNCTGNGTAGFLTHINYWVWILWVVAIFPGAFLTMLRWLRRPSPAMVPPGEAPSAVAEPVSGLVRVRSLSLHSQPPKVLRRRS